MTNSSDFETILDYTRRLDKAVLNHDTDAFVKLHAALSAMEIDSLTSARCREILDADRSLLLPFELGYAVYRRLVSDAPTKEDYRRFAFWLRVFGPDHDQEADDLTQLARSRFGDNCQTASSSH